jgi:hypothetical protein
VPGSFDTIVPAERSALERYGGRGKSLSDNSGCLSPIAVGLLVWAFWPDSWTNTLNSWTDTLWYAAEYKVSMDNVHTNKKPKDCDWMRAPLGDKGCHFKRIVAAFNASGEQVGGDDAPKYSRDTKTGKPIVSYDNGKTWGWFPAPEAPDLKVKNVEVRWTKVTDDD